MPVPVLGGERYEPAPDGPLPDRAPPDRAPPDRLSDRLPPDRLPPDRALPDRALPDRALPGRSREQARLRALVAAARSGAGGSALLVGEPGIGKTAMLRAAAAAAADFRVLATGGAETESGVPLAGLHGVLRPVTDRLALLPDGQAAALAAALEPGASGAEPARQLLLAAATLRLLTELARSAPVLCCVDDVQWLDGPSLHALAFAARRLDRERVLLLFAGRDPGGERYRAALAGVPVIRLGRLDPDAGRAVVEQFGGAGGAGGGAGGVGGAGADGLAAGVAAAVARLAAGNPLAAVELTGSLTPDQRAGLASLPEAPPADGALAGGYLAAVHRLPAPTRALLLLAAADPQPTVHTLLCAAAEDGLDAAALEPAELAGLVRVDGSNVYFGHPLVRPVVYRDASLIRRRAAHAALARAFGAGHDRFRSAWHRAAAAGAPDAALADELAAAALEVRRRGGYADSSAAFERSAQLSRPGAARAGRLLAAARDGWLAGWPHRARTLLHAAERSTGSAALRGRVDLLRGDLELSAGDLPTAHEALLSAARQLLPVDRELAVRAIMRAGQAAALAGDHAGYLQTARLAGAVRRSAETADAELVFEYLAGMSAVIQDDPAGAEPALRRVLRLADRCTDTAAPVWCSVAALILGDVRAARQAATRAVATARARAAQSAIPQALEALVYVELAAGRYHAALPSALEGLRLAEQTGQPNCASQHLAALALLSAVDGDELACLDRAGAVADQATARGLGLAAALAACAEAMLHLAHGRAGAAATRFGASARAGVGRTHFAVGLLSLPHLVEAAAGSGDRPRARAAADGYRRWATTTGGADWLALAARCEALLADGPAAEEHFREALRLHGQATADFQRARTELLFGAVLRRQRRPGLAREHLHEALDTFRHYDARLWIARTQAELRAAGEPGHRPATAPAEQLTAQQLQIAHRVATGATNREIAAQLFLSPRTIDHHLRNIYTRLGIRSRVDLARLLT